MISRLHYAFANSRLVVLATIFVFLATFNVIAQDKGVSVAKADLGDDVPVVIPAAILKFSERGKSVSEMGNQVTDLLFANLVTRPELYLVERDEMDKILKEQELNLSGAVNAGQAVQVGQLTGARILITGSVLRVENTTYLVAKLISTETSRVFGASAKGTDKDSLEKLTKKLAGKITETIEQRGKSMMASPIKPVDRAKRIAERLGDTKRPTLWIEIKERHVGQVTIDPAAETELSLIAKAAGFEVLDHETAGKSKADVIITGEGLSEFALRRGNLTSVKARVEIKAVDRKGTVLVIDRQTKIAVNLGEQIAGKSALQGAAAEISQRVLTKLGVAKKPQKKGKAKNRKKDRNE